MTDIISAERRSEVMSLVRGKNTQPEVAVRSLVHGLGFRFRLHRKDLPGRPDIVLPRLLTVIFVHGCFWHRHPDCKHAYTPKSRASFWKAKFNANVRRDARVQIALEELGWKAVIVWACELRDSEQLKRRLNRTLRRLSRARRGGASRISR